MSTMDTVSLVILAMELVTLGSVLLLVREMRKQRGKEKE